MPTYYLTFASKTPFRNGWVEIEADNKEQATKLVESAFYKGYYNLFHFIDEIYSEEQFNKSMFPLGKIGDTIK